MKEILKTIFGTVIMNKVQIHLDNGKNHPFLEIVKEFWKTYKKLINDSETPMKFYLVVAPFFNLFILQSFRVFLIVAISDFYRFRKVTTTK